jgi:hypothetical protein
MYMLLNKRKLIMRSRYDGNPGKEASIAKTRHNRLEAEHSAKNQFVKKVQNEQARHAGRSPNLKGESMEFNAYMCNNGEHAQMLAKDLTKGLDNVAFPVDGEGNDS